MNFPRSSGILLHPTSLPGPYGIGDIGPQAIQWLDFLVGAGCSLWQVLPLGPTGYGDSPYQCFSAFAGNPYLISPELLLKDGLLRAADLSDVPAFPQDKVEYGQVIPWKTALLDTAFTRFCASARPQLRQAMAQFKQQNAAWLDDYGLYMALKEAHAHRPWTTWEPALRDRDPQALAQARQEHSEAVERVIFRQFVFFRQWAQVREAARKRGVTLIGDIPIFVAHDSADVWSHRELFYLDETGQPLVVAGVPPDYYSRTGQRWGNPLYRWEVHQQSGYAWWLERIHAQLKLVDLIRMDHFRGFAAYWEVPGKAKTAIRGRWVPAPGMDFFRVMREQLGDLPFIAEDLGVITPDVVELRDTYNLPGMKVLQFGFSFGPKDPFLPHNVPQHSVMYTGTHDNDTSRGWYERVPDNEKDFCRRYLARDGHDISWDMIRAVWGAVSAYALAPMQDLLGLGNEARMNYPGNPSGNWQWRMTAADQNELVRARMHEFNFLYNRLPEKPKAARAAKPKA
ncbi:MAG: 4-alpha-glucanotransferase [Chloroflexota bacterium]